MSVEMHSENLNIYALETNEERVHKIEELKKKLSVVTTLGECVVIFTKELPQFSSLIEPQLRRVSINNYDKLHAGLNLFQIPTEIEIAKDPTVWVEFISGLMKVLEVFPDDGYLVIDEFNHILSTSKELFTEELYTGFKDKVFNLIKKASKRGEVDVIVIGDVKNEYSNLVFG